MDQNMANLVNSSEIINNTSDYFNKIIGLVEDIVIGEQFHTLQRNFMEKYYHHFDDTEENKIIYTEIFDDYTNTTESYIVNRLNEEMKGNFDMDAFARELIFMKPQLEGEIFELLFSLTDFLTFKEMMLDYKAFKNGAFTDFSSSITVFSLNNSTEMENDDNDPNSNIM